VVNESTKAVATYGTGLLITNASPSYPIYFGVDGLLNDHLEPKGSKVIHLARYQPGTGQKQAVVANLYLKYWDDEGGSTAIQSAASGQQCDTWKSFFYYVGHLPPSDYMKSRHLLVSAKWAETVNGTMLTVLAQRYGHFANWSGPYGDFFVDTGRALFVEQCSGGTSAQPETCTPYYWDHPGLPGGVSKEDSQVLSTFRIWTE
jgi:hypothetical protein